MIMSETYSIGVDLGGTNLRVASYGGGVDFLDSTVIPTRLAAGRDQVMFDLCGTIAALMGKQTNARRLVGIGIGAPGPLELPDGILRNPPNLPGWDGFNLRHAIESALRMPVNIECDANVAALAEQKLGAGKSHGADSLCVLTLGTGVGSGLILNGEIWHGSTGMGGEAGHIVVHDPGEPCGCGGHGCLEQYASATAVLRMGRQLMPERAIASAHEVALLAGGGDAKAAAVFERVGHALAIGLTGLINTLNLPLYLLGGGVCEAWDLFAPTMFRELRERSYVYRLTEPDGLQPVAPERNKTYILRAQLGPAAGLLGACLLPYQKAAVRTESTEDWLVHQ
jgi:glucokinase